MKHHLFDDGEKVLLNGETVTVKEWAYAPNMARFTYTIMEYPETFFFEYELTKL